MPIQRTTKQILAELSAAYLTSVLGENIVLNELSPDYGFDFFATLAVPGVSGNQDISNTHALIQLKSTERPKYSKHAIRVPVSKRHQELYQSHKRTPVFVVAVDLSVRAQPKGYFVFLQDLLYSASEHKVIPPPSGYVRIPLSNVLGATEFCEAMRTAPARLARIYPPSVQDALKAEAERIEHKDPRIRVLITGSGLHSKAEIHPRDEGGVEFSVQFSGKPGDIEAVARAMAFGDPVDATAHNVEIRVKDLPGELGETHEVAKLVAKRERDASVRVVVVGGAGSVLSSLPIPCKITQGVAQCRVSGGLASGIWTVSGESVCESPMEPMKGLRVKSAFSLEPWIGHDVRALQDLDAMAEFTLPLSEPGTRARMDLSAGGVTMRGKEESPAACEDLYRVRTATLAFAALRRVSFLFDEEIETRDGTGWEELAELAAAFELMMGQEQSCTVNEMGFTIDVVAGSKPPPLDGLQSFVLRTDSCMVKYGGRCWDLSRWWSREVSFKDVALTREASADSKSIQVKLPSSTNASVRWVSLDVPDGGVGSAGVS